jgi:hypothetical protein
MLSKGGNMREFRISEVNVEKTLIKAQKIAQRGQKQGLSGGFKVSIQERVEEIKGVEFQYQVLVIEGEPLKYQGWEFVGVAEFVEEQIILHGISEEIAIQASDVKKGYCDHCQKVRNRGKVIFVKSEDGKLSQVGSSCVKDFLGWNFYASALVTEQDFEDEFGGVSGGGISAISTEAIIAHAIKAVQKLGYVKASGEGLSTKDLVWGVLKNINQYNEIWAENEIGEAGEAEYEKARQLIEWGKNFEGESSYAQNVRSVCQLGFQKDSTVGIAVSIVKVEANQREKAIVEKIEFKKEQFAETGSKVEVEVTVAGSNTFETQYGWTTLFTFVNEGGYQFKWFASNGGNVEIGEKVKIKGTVKGSDEYKDVFSTVLTRCKFL